MINFVLGHWVYPLLGLLVVTTWLVWGTSALKKPHTYYGLILLWVLFFLSNSAQLVPLPQGHDFEEWRRWELQVKDYQVTTTKIAVVLCLLYGFYLANLWRKGASKAGAGVALLMIATVIAATLGNALIDHGVCKFLDPFYGQVHEFYATGRRGPACYRFAASLGPHWFGYVGPYLAPGLTILPMVPLWIRVVRRAREQLRDNHA